MTRKDNDLTSDFIDVLSKENPRFNEEFFISFEIIADVLHNNKQKGIFTIRVNNGK